MAQMQGIQSSIISSSLLASELMKLSAYKYKEANEIMSNYNELQSFWSQVNVNA